MSPVARAWIAINHRINYLTRIGCRVEFNRSPDELHPNMLYCTITPPESITSTKFRGFGQSVDTALEGAYSIAMQAGVIDPVEAA